MRRGSLCKISAQRGGQPKRKRKKTRKKPGFQITLTRVARRRLERMSRKTRNARMLKRIQIVLMRNQSKSYREIARSLYCSTGMINSVLTKWEKWGEAGLEDHRQDNGNPKVDFDYMACLWMVLEDTSQCHGWRRPTWTREMLIKTVGKKTGTWISLATMSKVLKSLGIRKKRPKPVVLCPWSKHKRTRRLNQIRSLLKRVRKGEIVLYEDEVDIHLNPKIGADWMLPGHQRMVVTPGQNKKRYIAGAWDSTRKEMVWVESDKKRSGLFIDLCRKLITTYPSAKKIHLILDNYVIHSSKITKCAIDEMDGRIVLHFLPPYCPQHNRIERVWKDLHDRVTRNHKYKSIHGLMCEVRRHLNEKSRKTETYKAKKAA